MSNNSPAKQSTVVPAPVTESPEILALKAEVEAMKAERAALQSANEALKAQVDAPRQISLKVSEKGALSLYGMGRFPVTMYKEQWRTILAPAQSKVILDFITNNESKLKAKGDETAEEMAARKARVEAYSAEARAKQANVNGYKPGDGQTGHKAV